MENKITVSETYISVFKDYPDVVSVEQMSEMLQISTKTAYKLLHENRIVHFRFGYFPQGSWKKQLAAHTLPWSAAQLCIPADRKRRIHEGSTGVARSQWFFYYRKHLLTPWIQGKDCFRERDGGEYEQGFVGDQVSCISKISLPIFTRMERKILQNSYIFAKLH